MRDNDGGAIHLNHPGTAIVTDSTFKSNYTPTGSGGALQLNGDSATSLTVAHSTLVPREKFAALLATVPGAEGVEIADAHHHVMLDNPSAFARVVRVFLDKIAMPPSTPRTLEPVNLRTL